MGSLPANQVDKFKEKLDEGGLGAPVIHGCCCLAQYRTTYHLYKVRISQDTMISEVVPVPENFPLYVYDIISQDTICLQHVARTSTPTSKSASRLQMRRLIGSLAFAVKTTMYKQTILCISTLDGCPLNPLRSPT
jgi:hypothetical protein